LRIRFAVIPVIILTLAACSPGPHATTAPPPPSTAPVASPSPSPTQLGCTTSECIVTDLQKSLPGAIAANEAVITQVACKPASVRHDAAGNTWTADCTATYSDGARRSGYGTVVAGRGKVTFEPCPGEAC
jgi:hypothetical protein